MDPISKIPITQLNLDLTEIRRGLINMDKARQCKMDDDDRIDTHLDQFEDEIKSHVEEIADKIKVLYD